MKIETAVISVSDKTGVVEFAKFLASKGVKIISTGGTGKKLSEAGIGITQIQEITGNEKGDYFSGRMKTISFNYESALLYRRDDERHVAQARELGIPKIDMVVCNLYPFEKTVAAPDVTVGKAVDNIDIGGPCMVRAAAKNFQGVAIVVDPAMYGPIMQEMEQNDGDLSLETRKLLAATAFERTADYDSSISAYFSKTFKNKLEKRLKYVDGEQLGRYAENWHQKGWLYRREDLRAPNVPNAKQVHGGPMGYNNYVDAEAALASALEFKDKIAVSVIKHSNPCGYAVGETLEEAFEKAWQGDPVSAFGSVIALTRPMNIAVARLVENRFVEVIIAPKIEKDALEYIQGLGKKKAGLRLLEYGDIPADAPETTKLRAVAGGLLEQENDDKYYLCDDVDGLTADATEMTCANSGKKLRVGVVTAKKPPAARSGLVDFTLRHLKHVKSNAISICREYAPGKYQTLGMGCGQPNRRDAVALAGQKAADNLRLEYFASAGIDGTREEYISGASESDLKEYLAKEAAYVATQLAGDNVALASEAFFPFRDGLDNAAATGVKLVIEPGGSVRDDEVIAAADEHGIAMIFTGVRKFNH